MDKTANKHRAENCPTDMSGLGSDIFGLSQKYRKGGGGICLVHIKTIFLTLILELRGIRLDETWTQGPPQHKEQVPKEVFFKSKDFSSDFG
jgi:hypothetical protein